MKNISKKKIALINLLVNYSNTFFLILNGLVLVPIYFKYFSLNIYGSYLASANIAGILGLLEFGLSLVFTQKLAVLYKSQKYFDFYNLMSAGLVASFILVSILISISLIIAPFVPEWVKASPGDSSDIKYAFIINSLGIAFNIYSNTITSIFQALSRVKISGIINVVSALLGIIATVLSLYFGFGIKSISIGIFIKSFSCVIALLPFLILNINRDSYPRLKVQLQLVVELLRDSLPIFGNTVSKSLIDNAQLLIITNFINPTATVIYSLTSKVFQLCNNLLAPIGSSIYSSLSQLVGENNHQNLKNNILRIFSLFTIFSIVTLIITYALNYSFISLWVGKDKFGGILLSLILCINMFVSSRISYINFNLFALGVFGKTVIYDQIGAIIRIILIFILIRKIGIISIPIAEIISSLFAGYYLNKLFIGKIGFENNEKIHFLYFGFFQFTILAILATVYQNYFPLSINWAFFSLNFFSLFLVVIIFLIFFNKNLFSSYTPILANVKKNFLKF